MYQEPDHLGTKSNRAPIDNSKLTCLWIFIFQIHVVAQLDSLRWIEVLFMVKTIDQVSSNLEFIWIFKNSFQNSKSLLRHLTNIDIGIPHSPNFIKQLDLVQRQRLEYTLWKRACKKMAPVWLHFDHQFWSLLIVVNALTMPSWSVINR